MANIIRGCAQRQSFDGHSNTGNSQMVESKLVLSANRFGQVSFDTVDDHLPNIITY
jgi:hypothetical protein